MLSLYVSPARARELLVEYHSPDALCQPEPEPRDQILAAISGIRKFWAEGGAPSPAIVERVKDDLRELLNRRLEREAAYQQLRIVAAGNLPGRVLLADKTALSMFPEPAGAIQ
jgi:hypothetical protein